MCRMKGMPTVAWISGASLIAVLLGACQSGPTSQAVAERDNRAAIALLQGINTQAQNCWRGDRAFAPYKVIPELDTRVGKPRILLVGAEAPQGLPRLVIEAEGTPARIHTYGPLAQEEIAARIGADLQRWAEGGKGCKEAAAT